MPTCFQKGAPIKVFRFSKSSLSHTGGWTLTSVIYIFFLEEHQTRKAWFRMGNVKADLGGMEHELKVKKNGWEEKVEYGLTINSMACMEPQDRRYEICAN